eukprot:TRINITY_DN139_c0_g1_i15.p4 TRINITY_DN139_c0_g1~~TRINITY_DN139_c0_g1_i15.p4  ORF type:complete len:108 (+),score=4.96 TRINITY_DN139_c0_g1_i15:635-958(+)
MSVTDTDPQEPGGSQHATDVARDSSSGPPPMAADNSAAAVTEAWEIIRRKGDVSLRQVAVPSALDTLWSPSEVTPPRSRPTLEWFQRFGDGLPAMFRERRQPCSLLL